MALRELGVYFDVGDTTAEDTPGVTSAPGTPSAPSSPGFRGLFFDPTSLPSMVGGAGGGGDWPTLTAPQWDWLFLPARHAPSLAGYHAHDYLVTPISGRMSYVRRWETCSCLWTLLL